jgi:hypothetical protein
MWGGRDVIDILACDALQPGDRTQQRGSDNVDARDRRRDPNSARRRPRQDVLPGRSSRLPG